MKTKNTVWEWMKRAVDTARVIIGLVPKNVRVAADKSLEVTTRIKAILDSPVADIVTAIIPGTWDDNTVQLMRNYLQKALQYLYIVDGCKGAETLDKMLLCWIEGVRKLHPDLQNAMLHKLAALLTAYQDSEALRQRMYDLYVQLQYVDKKG